jgi:hypothetical protein
MSLACSSQVFEEPICEKCFDSTNQPKLIAPMSLTTCATSSGSTIDERKAEAGQNGRCAAARRPRRECTQPCGPTHLPRVCLAAVKPPYRKKKCGYLRCPASLR